MDGMIAMLPGPLRRLSTHIDFQGQKNAERTYQVILSLSGIVGFIIGWYTQQLSYAIFTIMGAAAFTALIILPPWPFLFRKHPIVWQVPKPAEEKEKEEKKEEKKEKKEGNEGKSGKKEEKKGKNNKKETKKTQ